jgi:SAM-dependent methyltransferase
MRRDVVELRRFYATPLGAAAREMISRKVAQAWGRLHGLDVLTLGYATPFLGDSRHFARRVVAAMPSGQGVELWPAGGRNLACLVDETALPFTNALFDRILMVHGLEEADDPLALLQQAHRVLAPSGRMIVAAAARDGLWAGAECIPFGHGRPYSRRQLEQLVREADLEPLAWSRALYAPPVSWLAPHAALFEQVGARLWPGFSGLILLEVVKQSFAVKPRGLGAPARVRLPAGVRPVPAGRMQEPSAAAAPAQARLGGGRQSP